MTLKEAAVVKADIATAAINAVKAELLERGLDISLKSDWQLYQSIYDILTKLDVEVA